MKPRRHLSALAVAGVLLVPPAGARGAHAHEVPVPGRLQAELFVKILSYDRRLPESAGKDVVLGVLVQRHFRASLEAADELMAGVAALGEPSASEPRLHAVLVEIDDGAAIGGRLDELGVEVLYVTPLRAVAVAEIVAAARSRGVRTLTGVPDYVRQGLAIGLAVRGDRPEILVNLAAARGEGAVLSSQLLGMARVLR